MPVVLGHSSKTGTGDEANTRAAPDPAWKAPRPCVPPACSDHVHGSVAPARRCNDAPSPRNGAGESRGRLLRRPRSPISRRASAGLPADPNSSCPCGCSRACSSGCFSRACSTPSRPARFHFFSSLAHLAEPDAFLRDLAGTRRTEWVVYGSTPRSRLAVPGRSWTISAATRTAWRSPTTGCLSLPMST